MMALGMVSLLIGILACVQFLPSASVHQRELDASSSVPESQWYDASGDWLFLHEFCTTWCGPRRFHCVDVFSYSMKFATTFSQHGYHSVAYDIRNDRGDDITTKDGFLRLLALGLATLDPFKTEVHKRS